MMHDLPVVFAAVVVFSLSMYVLFDGLDLGVGILMLVTRDPQRRDTMVASISPVWDGNETWIVLSGVALFGGFPAVYGTLLPALYAPLIIMLLAMAFRGTAIEFRYQSRVPARWDRAFSIGSLVAALCQGLALGGVLQGVTVTNGVFAGSVLDVLTPFATLCAATVATGYAVLGASWLVAKTDPPLQSASRRTLRIAGPAFAVLADVVIVSGSQHAAAALRVPAYLDAIVLSSLVAASLLDSGKAVDGRPLRFAFGAIVASVVSIGLVSWPYVVRPSISLWNAGTPSNSQILLLEGCVLVIPVILAYTLLAYYVFRGKVQPLGDEAA